MAFIQDVNEPFWFQSVHACWSDNRVNDISPRSFCSATGGSISDIVISPPVDEPFTALKKRLCSQYAESETQRLRDLISGMQLGDRRPSRLLLDVRNKAGARISDELLKSLFLRRLPTNVQQISNDNLDEMADGIMAATVSQHSC
ncbi:uncharacterized protein [Parasteatoda tepidariorum]|uniref:uncharacterized protein n=1 Tax=Parasteatoda tepidariorum TaxID=114398 RepID=UPI0039BC30EF